MSSALCRVAPSRAMPRAKGNMMGNMGGGASPQWMDTGNGAPDDRHMTCRSWMRLLELPRSERNEPSCECGCKMQGGIGDLQQN
jgi:hypothetical protein